MEAGLQAAAVWQQLVTAGLVLAGEYVQLGGIRTSQVKANDLGHL